LFIITHSTDLGHYPVSDERVRNAIEGKFGQGKRRFSLGLVMAKLPETSETVIAIDISKNWKA
jgi:hypothetical protein